MFCPVHTSLNTSTAGPMMHKPSKPPWKPPSRIPGYTTTCRCAPGNHPATLSVPNSKPTTKGTHSKPCGPSTLSLHEQHHVDVSQCMFDEVFMRHVQNLLKMSSIPRARLYTSNPSIYMSECAHHLFHQEREERDLTLPGEDNSEPSTHPCHQQAPPRRSSLLHIVSHLTTLSSQLDKYKHANFGRCPCVLCQTQPLLPVSLTDVPYEIC